MILFAGVVLLAACSPGSGRPGSPLPSDSGAGGDGEAEQEDEMTIEYGDYQHKLSPETKRLLLSDEAVGAERLNVLLRLSHAPSEQELAELEANGCQVQTKAEDILTCQMAAGDLPRLAALESVVYLELSRPLYPEN